MNEITLGKGFKVNREKLLQSRMVILANSGGGKSYAVRKFAEQTVSSTQTIIIDPEGEFASLREKFDFILAGKNADVPAEPRSAELLAIKLLELNKSAVIDLYELHPTERQRFVKLFLDAMINAPKELYHPVFVILDEAHDYAPEGKPSEATYAVEAMASRGRKRGFCLIPASQRISKLSKNVSAECNNKLIGRASQDIDMKRAGDELGFNKESLVKLRQLKAGEFFAFGPAISDEVIQIKIGEVETTHAKVSYKGELKIPPPSSVIKKVLAEIKDLPKEAEKEAKTAQELKSALTVAKRRITELERSPAVDEKAIEKALAEQEKNFKEQVRGFNLEYQKLVNVLNKIQALIPSDFVEFSLNFNKRFIKIDKDFFKGMKFDVKVPPSVQSTPEFKERIEGDFKEAQIGKCGRAIYSYLALNLGQYQTKVRTAVATGYSQNSGGFNNAISELASAGMIQRNGGALCIIGDPQKEFIIEVDPSLEKWLPKLGVCARKIWDLMLNHHIEECWSKEQIANETGYSVTSGGFNNSISELSSLGLIERLPQAQMRINPELYNL